MSISPSSRLITLKIEKSIVNKLAISLGFCARCFRRTQRKSGKNFFQNFKHAEFECSFCFYCSNGQTKAQEEAVLHVNNRMKVHCTNPINFVMCL